MFIPVLVRLLGLSTYFTGIQKIKVLCLYMVPYVTLLAGHIVTVNTTESFSLPKVDNLGHEKLIWRGFLMT